MATRSPLYPSLYEINTRVLLREVGPHAGFDDLPDGLLDRLQEWGFDIVWMMGVWQTGPAGRAVSRALAGLADVAEEDVSGSPYAVQGYTAHRDFGSDEALARLRERLRRRGLRLLLDFVPNHTALDHPWVQAHPEFYVHGTGADLAREPGNHVRVDTGRGPLVLAHGRDPNFPGWPDTLQLDYRQAGLRAAMGEELLRVADCCDGVRCDMPMLILPDVFRRTWGGPAVEPFWPGATAGVRARYPDFLFLAEAYWELEWELLRQGFDYAYDKRLYDRLRDRNAAGVRAHLGARLDFQRRLARFLENHDEPRAAEVFPADVHRAAAVVAFLAPGMRFFHDGQFEGRRVHVSVHLGRRPAEVPDSALRDFYDRLLDCLRRPVLRSGRWRLLEARAAWEGNPTAGQFLVFLWEGGPGPPVLVAVNYGPTQGQCYVQVPLPELRGKAVLLRDLLGPAWYQRGGDELTSRGFYLDLPAWGYHVFEVRTDGAE